MRVVPACMTRDQLHVTRYLSLRFTYIHVRYFFILLTAAASGSCSTTNQSSVSKSHERQLIEIEILLYSFSQPSAEVCNVMLSGVIAGIWGQGS